DTRCYRDWSSDVCSSDLTPHSALRIPHLCGKALLHHAANEMLYGEMNFLDPCRVVRGDDQHDVAQVFEATARMPHEAHDRHPARDRKSVCRERVQRDARA